ncbi:tryptophan-rich sensory protein [Vibrio sp. SCSIO 43140]|uniref:TspO/MBR family protein n=1 Tax=Vibrio sp. SCSIO 43140 TaxID=2819100 RepID=UPI0020753A52|nr:TspO/MBR family protein [Vibrio sp. SCSIO 43140]USD63783.1 tryptophan-rich sensory protein [Vibrio sp. SCSIO 43140]
MSTSKKFGELFGWAVLCYAASAVGAAASLQSKAFYAALSQPVWAPPGWLFGPVWLVLFAFMALSVWLVCSRRDQFEVRTAVVLFSVQLVLNGLWSWMFFAWGTGQGAFLVILALILMISSCIVVFHKISRIASYLLLPYLAWVSFAAFLNFSLWKLNPTLL